MVKILSQAGMSLADVYDVVGSVAGIDQLESREVSLVHEMGGTLVSERMSSFIRRTATNNILQSVTWDITVGDLPDGMSRILSVAVFCNVTARISHAQISVREPVGGREVPCWAWDSAIDDEITIRLQDNDGAVADFFLLRPDVMLNLPGMLFGGGQRQQVPDFAFRGETAAFGAGNVTTVALVQLAFTHTGEISSFGLPVPSW